MPVRLDRLALQRLRARQRRAIGGMHGIGRRQTQPGDRDAACHRPKRMHEFASEE